MAEPYASSIGNVCEFTGLDPVVDRDLVVAALKEKSGNVEAVVAAFYDDEVKFRQSSTWVETHFLGDRDNSSENSNLPTFNVQGPDEGSVIHGVSPSSYHPGAPSRPPSRSQSPMSRMIDWNTQTTIPGSPVSRAQEDSELKRALAASFSLYPPQETGVIGGEADTNMPFFGPANRASYDADQWAMVRATPEGQEPAPSVRKRLPGSPAFLRCRKEQTESYNLNALLTILHAIPGIRNALLRSGTIARNYGQNSEWWRGSLIHSVGDAADSNDAVLAQPAAEGSVSQSLARDFAEEIHRIMAFLDDTDRAYGTADSFLDAKFAGESWDDNIDRRFFTLFREINAPDIYEKVFSDIGIVSIASMEDSLYTESYAILEAKMQKQQYCGELRDIYGVLETIYWADLTGTSLEPLETAKMAVSKRLGMVQVFNICVEGLEGPLEIPGTFYPDRYLAENRQLALEMQMKLRSISLALQRYDEARSKITTFRDTTNNFTLSQTVLSEQAIALALQKLWQLKASVFWRQYEASIGSPEEVDFNLADVDATELSAPQDVQMAKAIQAEISVHRQKLNDIEKKLQRLDEEKDACEQLLSRLRKQNVGPSDKDGWHPSHPYRLRGIILSNNSFYLCRRETSADHSPGSEPVDQWWGISYDASASEPVRVERTTLEAAQKAAFHGTSSSSAFSGTAKFISIYATDAAMEEAPEALPDALKTFVRFDNRFFKQELAEESPREKKRVLVETPTSPSKRQQRSNSIDSMATNKASIDELSDRAMSDGHIDDILPTDTLAMGEGMGGGYEDFFRRTNPAGEGTEQDSALGSEMVQLAISRPGSTSGKRPSTQPAVVGEGSKDVDSRGGGSEGGGHGQPDSGMASSRPDGAGNEAQGGVSIMADWDNPEGRYVGSHDPGN